MSRRTYEEIVPLIACWSAIEKNVMYHLSLENGDIFNRIMFELRRLHFIEWRRKLPSINEEYKNTWDLSVYEVSPPDLSPNAEDWRTVCLIRWDDIDEWELHHGDFHGREVNYRNLPVVIPDRNDDNYDNHNWIHNIWNFRRKKWVMVLPNNY